MADSPDRDELAQTSAEEAAAEPAADAAVPDQQAAEPESGPDPDDDPTVAEAETADDLAAASEARPEPTEPDAEGVPASADASGAAADDAEWVADADDAEGLGRATADLRSIVEALIFASPEPLTPKALMKLLDTEPKEDVLAALDAVKAEYEPPGGLQIVEVAGGFQIVTRPDLHEWVRRLFHERSTQKLSIQALETLAVIAYRQPITALEITEIRGVSASGVLNTLLERHLVKIIGRKQVVGRPFMYATTKEFLIRFGLKDISDLPKVEDMAESLGIDSPLLVEQTPPEEQLPLSEPDGVDAGISDVVPADENGPDDDSGEPTIN